MALTDKVQGRGIIRLNSAQGHRRVDLVLAVTGNARGSLSGLPAGRAFSMVVMPLSKLGPGVPRHKNSLK